MKPYIICYMMMSADGRIDCAMTEKLKGGEAYYPLLDQLELNSAVSGRHTAEMEMAEGKFHTDSYHPYGKEGFSKKVSAKGYDIILDSRGSLLWDSEKEDKPLLIITTTQVSQEYLSYLDEKKISYIIAGDKEVDLKKAVDVLSREFSVKRLGVVGGPTINTAFLEAGLLDEIILLIGSGIDGRKEMPSVFEGREKEDPVPLHLEEVKKLGEETVFLRYRL